MKLPNGYGSVYKLHGNRRKPWAVRVTVSRNPWKYKYLGYYETQQDALTALALYNKDPYDLDAVTITFAEVYDRWSAEHFPKVSYTTVRSYRAAYSACKQIHTTRWTDIRLSHLQNTVDSCGKNYPVLLNIKMLFSQLYKYAMQNDLCLKDYSKYVDIAQYKDRNPDRIPRSVFTPEELADLWSRSDEPYTMVVLMLICTGVRIMELLDLKKEDIDMQGQWFDVKASKTTAGIRRVPIADCVLPFFSWWMDRSAGPYLITTKTGIHMSYVRYTQSYWSVEGHLPHDTRHTFISLMADAKTDERITKRIVGHRGTGVTENVYTHFDFRILLDAVNKAIKKTPDR